MIWISHKSTSAGDMGDAAINDSRILSKNMSFPLICVFRFQWFITVMPENFQLKDTNLQISISSESNISCFTVKYPAEFFSSFLETISVIIHLNGRYCFPIVDSDRKSSHWETYALLVSDLYFWTYIHGGGE